MGLIDSSESGSSRKFLMSAFFPRRLALNFHYTEEVSFTETQRTLVAGTMPNYGWMLILLTLFRAAYSAPDSALRLKPDDHVAAEVPCFQVLSEPQPASSAAFPDPTLHSALMRARANWLAENAGASDLWSRYHTVRRPGEKIPFNGTELTIVGLLGCGGEGCVYTIDGPSGPRIAKLFDNSSIGMRENLDLLQSYVGPATIPRAKPVEIDWEKMIALFPYMEGVPLGKLTGTEGQRMGLSADQALYIHEQFANRYLRAGRANLKAVSLWQNNIVMNIHTGEFVLIDPY
jgi:hypothetical protein